MGRFKNLEKIVFVIFIVVILIFILPWQGKISTTIKGVQWKIGNEEYTENVSIKIKGKYNQYLMRKDTFKGIFSIDIYDFTHDEDLNLEFEDGKAQLIYNLEDNKFDSFGFLVCNPDFSNMLIGVNSPVNSDSKGWSGEDGLVICAPAKNREQGLEMAKKLSTRSKWLTTGVDYWK